MPRFSTPQVPKLALEYGLRNDAELGPCADCGKKTRRVWGYVYKADIAHAAYFVEWTPGHSERDASFDLIIGQWGQMAVPEDRCAVSVAYKVLESVPAFMVQDASARPIGLSSLASRALDRNEVVGQPIAAEVFEICDLIYLCDPRISELRV